MLREEDGFGCGWDAAAVLVLVAADLVVRFAAVASISAVAAVAASSKIRVPSSGRACGAGGMDSKVWRMTSGVPRLL